MVKALGQSEGVHFERPIQHLIDRMLDLLPDENPYKAVLKSHTWLEAYGTSYRYPRTGGGLNEAPTPERLQATLDALDKTIRDLAGHFAVNLNISTKAPAESTDAPRGPIGLNTDARRSPIP